MMIKAKTYWALLAAGMLFLGASACSDDSDSNDNTNNQAQPDVTESNDTDEPATELPEGWSFESDYSLRFTKFALDPDAPLNGLNSLLDKNIKNQDDRYPIVVLLGLSDIDADNGSLALRGGAGIKADLDCLPSLGDDCSYKWDPDDEGEVVEGATFDASTGEMTAGLPALDFIVTFETGGSTLKSAIPISDLTLTGALRPVGDGGEVSIENGVLKGYITKEAADVAEIQLTTGSDPILLSQLLKTTPLTSDLDEDGTLDAWYLTGTFIAEEASIVD